MPLTFAAYLHDISPVAVPLWGSFAIRWYGLSYLLGFVVGCLILRHLARRGRAQLEANQAMDMVFWIAVGVLVGGRLGYALFYQPDLFVSLSSSPPYWDLLAINKGGMASHGGLIGVIIASLWYARRNGFSFLHVIDLAVFAGAPGMFFGRIANFINGELFGRACGADSPLAVKFPQEMHDWSQQQLSPLLELDPPASATTSHASLVNWAIEQIHRGNDKVVEIVQPLLTPRHPSQLYQALIEGLLLFVVLAIAWVRPRKPGVIFGLCCCYYSMARIVGEVFREPDSHIKGHEFGAWGITRGQLLSTVMLLAGVAVISICAKRNVQKVGGILNH